MNLTLERMLPTIELLVELHMAYCCLGNLVAVTVTRSAPTGIWFTLTVCPHYIHRVLLPMCVPPWIRVRRH